ncbi:MAG: hypothetical protein R2737_12760 [Candidatus Nanopelagicales bacterium]
MTRTSVLSAAPSPSAPASHPLDSPPAARGRPPRWRDGRVLLGLVLVAVCVLVGVRVVSGADERTLVWAAARDLPAGAPLTPDAVVAVPVALGDREGAYLAGTSVPDGTLLDGVRAGELVPLAAVGATGALADRRLVTVPVEPLHVPSAVGAGDVVDVWVTPREEVDSSAAQPRRVLSEAIVAEVALDAVGAVGEVGVVLDVPADLAVDVVAAIRSGAVDLVRVPVGSGTGAAR